MSNPMAYCRYIVFCLSRQILYAWKPDEHTPRPRYTAFCLLFSKTIVRLIRRENPTAYCRHTVFCTWYTVFFIHGKKSYAQPLHDWQKQSYTISKYFLSQKMVCRVINRHEQTPYGWWPTVALQRKQPWSTLGNLLRWGGSLIDHTY